MLRTTLLRRHYHFSPSPSPPSRSHLACPVGRPFSSSSIASIGPIDGGTILTGVLTTATLGSVMRLLYVVGGAQEKVANRMESVEKGQASTREEIARLSTDLDKKLDGWKITLDKDVAGVKDTVKTTRRELREVHVEAGKREARSGVESLRRSVDLVNAGRSGCEKDDRSPSMK